jgi:hypothetical protein
MVIWTYSNPKSVFQLQHCQIYDITKLNSLVRPLLFSSALFHKAVT